jgi:hypothetical protein
MMSVLERDMMDLLLLPGSARVRRRKMLSLVLPSVRRARARTKRLLRRMRYQYD